MEAFSNYHPYCKINILERQTPGYSPPDAGVWNKIMGRCEFDMDTLKLPGLHTLVISLPQYSNRSRGYQRLDDVFPFLFTGPGLKHLCFDPNNSADADSFETLRAILQSLLDINDTKPISQLESLTVTSNGKQGGFLSELAAVGNLSQLRTLDIGCIMNPASLSNTAGLFPHLERLFIDLVRRNSPIVTKTDEEESIAGIMAFCPLKYLYIKGLRSAESLDRIIQHHGPSLKGLALVPFGGKRHGYPRLGPSELHEMAIRCPNLEELRLPVARSGGNQAECEMYKALGSFRNLQTIFLDLDFDARPKAPALGEHVTEDLDVLQKTFINAAMDENLALQIWSMIKGKRSCLKDLRLLPTGNQCFAPDERYLLFCLARSYLLTHYNLENPGSPVIEQIGKTAWEVKRAVGQTIVPDVIRDGELLLSDGVVSVLHSIWPQVHKQSDWWSSWTSLPLQPDNCLPSSCSKA
ncbi:hypothetical protein N7456_006329 [Penicillium angulare]|uniref:Uncharacterized protein n=1 Tax=Penicillium angulare TaxID=116970 RepID=A0A9W9KCR7_9EURO|nr:hypothetical protein N7456_006329 [Penicillium angulare]